MLAANEAVASHWRHGIAIYLPHPREPDPKRVMEFEEWRRISDIRSAWARFRWKDSDIADKRRRPQSTQRHRASGRGKDLPRHYQKLVAKIEGKPEERILST